MPYIVEGIFDGGDQVDDRIEQQNKTDPDDNTALCLCQIILYVLECFIQFVLMSGEIIEQFFPDSSLKAETFGDADQYCQ